MSLGLPTQVRFYVDDHITPARPAETNPFDETCRQLMAAQDVEAASNIKPARRMYDPESSVSRFKATLAQLSANASISRASLALTRPTLWGILLFLVPSFVTAAISRRRNRAGRASDSAAPRYTAYLDGLRGLAAIAVMNTHLCPLVLPGIGLTWGAPGTDYNPLRLPIVRLLYNGTFGVKLFFIISGFALSVAPIMLMRNGAQSSAKAMSRFSSSIFRRPLRLFGPTWASTLLCFLLIRIGYFSSLENASDTMRPMVPGIDLHRGAWAPRDPSFFKQLDEMIWYDLDMLGIFSASEILPGQYNAVAWTIKLEFRASLMLFLTHAAVFNMPKRARVLVTSVLIFMAMACGNWELPLFWAGYLIAEFAAFSTAELAGKDDGVGKQRPPLKRHGWWVLLLIGFFLGSYPDLGETGVGLYDWLKPFSLLDPNTFWDSLGAVLVVLSITRLPALIELCALPVVHYIGQISFSLYLMHLWVLHIIGACIFYVAWSITGTDSAAATTLGACIAYPLVLGVVVCVADIFWRAVDIPLTNAAYRLLDGLDTPVNEKGLSLG